MSRELTAVLATRITNLSKEQDELKNREELHYQEVKHLVDRVVKEYREESALSRTEYNGLLHQLHELKLIVAEHRSDIKDTEEINQDIEEIKKEQAEQRESISEIKSSMAGQRPWVDMVKGAVYVALGIIIASIFYLIGFRSQ